MCSRGGCCGSSGGDCGDFMGTVLKFGLGAAAIGTACYLLSGEEEPKQRYSQGYSYNNPRHERHERASRSSSSRSSSSSSSRTSGQNSEWRKNDSGHNQPDTCSICLENIPSRSARVLLGCGHEFHSTCIEPWLERHANCPVCRQNVE